MKLPLLCVVMLLPLGLWAQPHPDTLWTQTIPGFLNGSIYPYHIVRGIHGHTLLGGMARFGSYDHYESFVTLLGSDGTVLWSQFISDDSYIKAMASTQDGHFLVIQHETGFRVRCLDSTGHLEWDRSFCMPGYSGMAEFLAPVGDHSFIIGGHQRSSTVYGPCLVKITETGDICWTRLFTERLSWGWLNFVQPTPDGGYIAGGMVDPADPPDLQNVPWAVKTDSLGEEEWSRTYPPTSSYEEVLRICPIGESSYLASFGTSISDRKLAKLDRFGQIVSMADAEIYDLKPTPDGGALELVRQLNQLRLRRVDANGSILWEWLPSRIGAHPNSVDFADNGYVLGGSWSIDTTFHRRALIMQTGPDTLSLASPQRPASPLSWTLNTFPNPFNATTTLSFDPPQSAKVRLSVFDLLGREVAVLVDAVVVAGSHRVSFDGADLASGIYFARLAAGDRVQTRKVVVLK